MWTAPGARVTVGASTRTADADGVAAWPWWPESGRARVEPPAGSGLATLAFDVASARAHRVLFVEPPPRAEHRVRVVDHRRAPLEGVVVTSFVVDATVACEAGVGRTDARGEATFAGAQGALLVAQDPSGARVPIGRARALADGRVELVLGAPALARSVESADAPRRLRGRTDGSAVLWARDASTGRWSLLGFTTQEGGFDVETGGTDALRVAPLDDALVPRVLVGAALAGEWLDCSLERARPLAFELTAPEPTWVHVRGPDGHVVDGAFFEGGYGELVAPSAGLARIEAFATLSAAFVDLGAPPAVHVLAPGSAAPGDADTLAFTSPYPGDVAAWLPEPRAAGDALVASRVEIEGERERDRAGVLALLWSGTELVARATTDWSGAFRFEYVDRASGRGPWHVTFVTPWWSAAVSRAVGYFDAEELATLRPQRLERSDRVTGTLVVPLGLAPESVRAFDGAGPELQLGAGALESGRWWSRAGAELFVTLAARDGSLVDARVESPEHGEAVVGLADLVEPAPLAPVEPVVEPLARPLDAGELTVLLALATSDLPMLWRDGRVPEQLVPLLARARDVARADPRSPELEALRRALIATLERSLADPIAASRALAPLRARGSE